MKKVTLPSGNEIEIQLAPFEVSKALYMAVMDEAKDLKLDPHADMDVNLYKDIFCSALSSKKIESCLLDCMKRVLYKGQRIDKDTFEPEDARQDYIPTCFEVAQENIAPFMKSLYAKYSTMLEKVRGAQV